MKKIIIIILSCLFIGGCYDYVELNDLSVITMIVIDKYDNNYHIAFEILNDQKQSDKSVTNKSIIVKGSGPTLSQAISNTMSKTPKQPYLAHLKVMAISKTVAKENLKEVIEYFLRAPHIRNEYYIVTVDNQLASEILEVSNDEILIISDYIKTMLENNLKSSNSTSLNNFENIIIDIFEKGNDASMPVIKKNTDKIEVSNTALFNKFNLKTILNTKESSLLNILTNKSQNILLTYKCPNSDKNISFSIYNSKTSVVIKQNIKINNNVMGQIEEYQCNDNLKDYKTFEYYNNYYASKINEDLKELFNKMLHYKTDALGIGKRIYIKKRKFKKEDWTKYNYDIKTNLKINKEGLIYEVTNGN